MKTAITWVRTISGLLNSLSGAALTILMALVTLNVILRAVFKSPILGTYDLTGLLTAIVIGCGLAYCNIENGHIDISLFVDKAGAETRRWITVIGQIMSFIILSAYTYSLFVLGLRLMRANEVSVTAQIPVFPFVFLLSFCFLIFTLTVFLKIIELPEKEKQM